MKLKRNRRRYVYFAQHPIEDLIKIGCSIRPFERAHQQNIQIIGLLKDHRWQGRTHENSLHERFEHQKVRTEWFRDCNELRHFIFHSGAHGNLWTGMAKRQKAAVRAKG